MKLLLINPSYLSEEQLLFSYGEPLGIAYIAAAIEKSGRHEVELLDGIGLQQRVHISPGPYRVGIEPDDITAMVNERSFDVLGVSVTRLYCDVGESLMLLKRLRTAYPGVPIIVGGPDVALSPEIYLETRAVDALVLGEGEATVVELLDALEHGMPLSEIAGLALANPAGEPAFTTPRRPVPIDSIPWPARHLLPMENYFANKVDGQKCRTASILTSRGCPERCVFCNISAIWGKKWRGRVAMDVVAEMEHLVTHYGTNRINIVDDNFMVNEPRVDMICHEIGDRGLVFEWQVVPGVAAWHLTPERLERMVASGLSYLQIQVETGNQKTMDYIGKRVSLNHVRDLLRNARALGIRSGSNIIIGFPYETREEIARSIEVAQGLGLDDIDFILAEPKPGTKMYRDFEANGLLISKGRDDGYFDTIELTVEELREVRDKANDSHRQSK